MITRIILAVLVLIIGFAFYPYPEIDNPYAVIEDIPLGGEKTYKDILEAEIYTKAKVKKKYIEEAYLNGTMPLFDLTTVDRESIVEAQIALAEDYGWDKKERKDLFKLVRKVADPEKVKPIKYKP